MENIKLIDYHVTRDFGTKISVTFEFMRQNFVSLGKSLLLIAGPPILIASLLMGSFIGDMLTVAFNAGRSGDPAMFEQMFSPTSMFSQVILMMLAYGAAYVAAIATINNYVLLYEERKSNKISTNDVWDKVRSTVWMYAGTIFLFFVLLYAGIIGLAVVIGAIAAVAPVLAPLIGIAVGVGVAYIVVGSSLIFIIRAYERRGFFDAIQRSLRLMRGKWWSTFGLVFVLSLIASVISYIFLIPGYVITLVAGLHNVNPTPEQMMGDVPVIAMVFFALYYAAIIMLQSLTQVGLAFQYFNLVERKEAKGLMNKIDSLGEPTQASGHDEQY